MRSAYRVLAILIVVGVFIQAASIAFGVFDIFHAIDEGAVVDKAYEIHEEHAGIAVHGINGIMFVPLLSLILFIVSFFAKIPGGVKCAGLILLAVVVQIALVFISFGVPILGALHGMNALVIVGLAINAARKAQSVAPVTAGARDAAGAPAG